jgi:hypothetical protein
LGDLLPFAAEFWRRYMTSLLSRVLEMSFPSTRMVFPFPPPFHWRNYERMFNCPIDFSAETMEWHFNADVLGAALPKCQSDHGEDLPAGCATWFSANNPAIRIWYGSFARLV